MMQSFASSSDPYRLSYRHAYGRGFENTNGRVRVSAKLDPGEETAVMILVGQSLAGNWNDAAYTPTNTKVENFNIFDGGVYRCSGGPLLGCDGGMKSNGTPLSNIFPRVGDKLIDAEHFDRVIFAPMALGGSAINVWLGPAAERILVMKRRLDAAGLAATHILFSGGETDAALGTSQATCEANLLSVLAAFRTVGIDAPMWVARETWASGSQPAGAAAVRAAQAAVVDNVDIFAGPDLDTLNNTNRDDTETHFNATGADAAAGLWLAALTA